MTGGSKSIWREVREPKVVSVLYTNRPPRLAPAPLNAPTPDHAELVASGE